jgi:hypothetical protein
MPNTDTFVIANQPGMFPTIDATTSPYVVSYALGRFTGHPDLKSAEFSIYFGELERRFGTEKFKAMLAEYARENGR